MSEIAENYHHILDRMDTAARRSGRNVADIQLIAVTKTVSPDRIRAAVACGVSAIGENRLQEALTKREALADLPLQWHFIGGLQTNKARKAAELFDCIHSIDRQELALKLNGSVTGRKLKVLIEVNLGGELSKSGVAPAGLDELASAIRDCPNLELAGLMTVPPYMEDVEEVRPFFRALRQKAEALGLPELSMGMSHDFEIAIEEGATMIRVGTALFGARA